MAGGSQLRIRLLGGLVVDGYSERDLGSRKGRTLLKRLAVGRGGFVSIDQLVDALWGDEPPSKPNDESTCPFPVSAKVRNPARCSGTPRNGALDPRALG